MSAMLLHVGFVLFVLFGGHDLLQFGIVGCTYLLMLLAFGLHLGLLLLCQLRTLWPSFGA